MANNVVVDKNAIRWTRLSCRKFRNNAVRLQLHALALLLALLPFAGEITDFLLRPHRTDVLSGRLPLWSAYLSHFPRDPENGSGGYPASADLYCPLVNISEQHVVALGRVFLLEFGPCRAPHLGEGLEMCYCPLHFGRQIFRFPAAG